jgi:polyphosphate kinase
MKRAGFTYFDRELSWLAFNGRVLQEAADPTVPLGERLNFLGIFSSNLDEFFRVRVASLRSLLRLKPKRVEELDFNPAELLREIHRQVSIEQNRFGELLRGQIQPALAQHGIWLVTDRELTAVQRDVISDWFDEHVAHRLQPMLLDDGRPAPFLHNRETYLVVELWPGEGRGVGGAAPNYALVNVPSPPLPRFLTLEEADGSRTVVFLDDIVRLHLERIFPANEVGHAYAIKLTRDAELYLEDEFSGDLVQSIRKSLKKRETGLPCRFLYDLNAPYPLVGALKARFDLADEDLVQGGRYHNLHDLSDVPRLGSPELWYPPLPPLPHPELDDSASMLEAIRERDRLLQFPYQRFDYVLRLLDEAAADPDVEEIWITLYRVARDSAVAESLVRAAAAGKRVTAFVEIKARFDEESNLACAERLEHAGVRTFYSMPGLKVHAKLLMIVRREAGRKARYAYLGTGNFNEKTARLYSDLALLTADPRLTGDVRRVFAFLVGSNKEPDFEHLLVAPFHLRKQFYRLIDQEIAAAAAGEPAGMILKMNSLEDQRIITRLYEASRAGVPIQLIVRGICCLVPQVPEQSETIEARSIVDRFLEHSRMFWFENRGSPLCYLGSADWMTRNLNRRVEVTFPIYDVLLQQEIRALLDLQLRDNRKARTVDAGQTNPYAGSAGESEIRAQTDTYRRLQTRLGSALPTSSPRAEPLIDYTNPAHA